MDKRAWNVLLEAGRHLKPDTIIVMGDFIDCYAVSSHQKNPANRVSIEDEIAAGNAALDQLEALGATRLVYIEGNHESRMPRYIADRAPEIHAIAPTIRNLLRVDERGWEWVPYRDHITIGKCHYTHDLGKAGDNAHVDARKRFESNVVMAHVHKLGASYGGNLKGETHVGVCAGWLGSAADCEYLSRAQAMSGWQLGFCTTAMESDGTTHIQTHPIINYRAFVDGKLIAA